MEIDSLGSIGLFVRVAEKRSFSAVARDLGLSPSAVGKAVARLEARLGVRLFNRSTRTLALTSEGERFLERCRRILCEVEAAQLELSRAGERPRGRLRVSLPRHSGLFEEALSDFLMEHPEVELDLNFSDHLVDVIGDGFDVALRAAPLEDSGLQHRRLRGFRRMLVGAPAYFERQGRPRQPADLAQHQCLHYRYPGTGRLERWPLAPPLDAAAPAELPRTVVCNSVEMRIFMALRGQGIACLPDFTVAGPLADGRLVSVLDDCLDPEASQGTVWMLWPAGRDLSPRVRAFLECMGRRLAR
jgi:DNA-binding transcriptional LysR family regulator